MTSVIDYFNMGDNDEPAALLTNTQRDYLKGEKSVTPSYERNLRDNIHDRIEATMGDFVTLFCELDQEDVQEAFDISKFATQIGVDSEKMSNELEKVTDPNKIDKESVEEDVPQPRGTAANAPAVIAFLLRGLNEEEQPIYEFFEGMDEPQPAFRRFTEVVEQGISMYLQQETNYAASVSVSIDLENLEPIDELIENPDE